MTVNIITLGCKVNQYESESMRQELINNGFVNNDENADIYVVNSCTVTGESDHKTKKIINRIKREHPNAIIVLTGCMAQVSLKEALSLPVDIILGNTQNRNLTGAINTYLKTKQRVVMVEKHTKDEPFLNTKVYKLAERTRAYLKIEDGCNRGCTYCIIPKAKGRVRSRTLNDIKLEAERLESYGYKEIVLVGINLSSYQYGLENAVKAAASPKGILRVRLGSLEPDLTTKELLLKLKEIPEFCPQFHLALQSGCNNTLKRMNRHYTAEDFLNLTKLIKTIFKNASFTTDVMVGFAGETEEDFLESTNFIKKIGFLHCHIFPYSVRKGTFAANYKNQLTKAEKLSRAKRMKAICDETALIQKKNTIGTIKEVLLETKNSGYTKEYLRVYLNQNDNLNKGNIIKVEILDIFKDGVLAKPL